MATTEASTKPMSGYRSITAAVCSESRLVRFCIETSPAVTERTKANSADLLFFCPDFNEEYLLPFLQMPRIVPVMRGKTCRRFRRFSEG